MKKHEQIIEALRAELAHAKELSHRYPHDEYWTGAETQATICLGVALRHIAAHDG